MKKLTPNLSKGKGINFGGICKVSENIDLGGKGIENLLPFLTLTKGSSYII